MLAGDGKSSNLEEASLDRLTVDTERPVADGGSATSSRAVRVGGALHQSPLLHLSGQGGCDGSGAKDKDSGETHDC